MHARPHSACYRLIGRHICIRNPSREVQNTVPWLSPWGFVRCTVKWVNLRLRGIIELRSVRLWVIVGVSALVLAICLVPKEDDRDTRWTTSTPRPATTSTPTASCATPAERTYFDTMERTNADLSGSFESLVPLFESADNDTNVLFDPTWWNNTERHLDQAKTAASGFEDVDVPPSVQYIHDDFGEAMRLSLLAINWWRGGLDFLRQFGVIEGAAAQIAEGNAALERATPLLASALSKKRAFCQ